MKTSEFEVLFMRVFAAKPCQFNDELFWQHGNKRFRVRYPSQSDPQLGSFIHRTYLDHVSAALVYTNVGAQDWEHTNTAEDAVKWVARQIITLDAA